MIAANLFADANPPILKTAIISDCGRYRYRLTREWSSDPLLPFVMLNPSTADAEIDDPTIRRCMAFARREGAGGIYVVNLFALRTPRPTELLRVIKENERSAIGEENGRWLGEAAAVANRVDLSKRWPIICAWGAHAPPRRWTDIVWDLERCSARLMCLGKTKGGHPRHPLFVRADQPLEPFP